MTMLICGRGSSDMRLRDFAGWFARADNSQLWRERVLVVVGRGVDVHQSVEEVFKIGFISSSLRVR
jgi:hypothetical protein